MAFWYHHKVKSGSKEGFAQWLLVLTTHATDRFNKKEPSLLHV